MGKRGRGEENIDIIDVNADDQVGSSQEWKTNYQKEDADYKPQSKVNEWLIIASENALIPTSLPNKKVYVSYSSTQLRFVCRKKGIFHHLNKDGSIRLPIWLFRYFQFFLGSFLHSVF